MKQIKALDYPFTIRHLSTEDGGGYLIEFSDLPGCMSDGDTIQEAITEIHSFKISQKS
jgi:antitoxin HicB